MEASAAARYIGCVDAILAAGLYWYALRAVLHKAQAAVAADVPMGLSLHSSLAAYGSELRYTGGVPCRVAESSSDGETAGPQVLCAPSV